VFFYPVHLQLMQLNSRHRSALGLIHLRSIGGQEVCVFSLLLARRRHCYAGRAIRWALPPISSFIFRHWFSKTLLNQTLASLDLLLSSIRWRRLISNMRRSMSLCSAGCRNISFIELYLPIRLAASCPNISADIIHSTSSSSTDRPCGHTASLLTGEHGHE